MGKAEAAGCAHRALGVCSSEAPDDEVLDLVLVGKTAPYEVLVRRYNPRLRRMVRRVLSNEADVEDVIQETHCRALRFLWQFSGRSSFGAWLTRIAFNAALSRLRERARFRESNCSSSGDEPFGIAASSQPNPEQQLQQKEMKEALESAARTLPETYRAVFRLREIEELSTGEVAVRLEISMGCANRAQVLLRTRLRVARHPSDWTTAIRESSAARHWRSGPGVWPDRPSSASPGGNGHRIAA